MYICDDCDHSGIWQVDLEVAEIRIGEKLDCTKAIQLFGDKIIPIDKGAKWFIPSFIEFQYPSGLNPENRAHNSTIILLEKYNLLDKKNKPLKSPLKGAMDMDKDKEEQLSQADHEGLIAGVTQTAQQNYLQQNAPSDTQEAPTSNQEK